MVGERVQFEQTRYCVVSRLSTCIYGDEVDDVPGVVV